MQDIDEKKSRNVYRDAPPPLFQTLSFGQTKLLTHENSLFRALR